MKKLLCIFLFSLPSFLSGQLSYYPGYAVGLSGDTIRGLLKLERGIMMQDGTEFFPDGKEEKTDIRPEDFTAMGLTGHRHFIVAVKNGQRLFAELLIPGSPALVQIDRDPYMLREGELTSLKGLSKQYRKTDSTNLEMPAFRYGGALHFMLEECPGLSLILDQFDFQLSSLQELFLEYQRCTTGSTVEIQDAHPQPAVFIRPSIGAGVSLMHFDYQSGYLDYLNLADYRQQFSWRAGLDMRIGKPVHWNRVFLNLGLHYHYNDFDFKSAYVTDTSQVNESLELGIQMIKFAAGPRTRLALGRSELELCILGQMNFRTVLKTDRLLEVNLDTETVDIEGEIQPPQDIFFGVQGGLEWALPYRYNKCFFMGLSWSFDFPWMDVVGLSAYIQSIHFYLGFDL